MNVDVNAWVDRQSLDEERDNRKFGNDEFDYLENSRPKAINSEDDE